MITIRAASILAILATISVIAGCVGPANSNSSNSSAVANLPASNAKTNVEELGLLIKVPYETVEAVWREDDLGGEAAAGAPDKRLVAVMRFSESDADRIVANAGEGKQPEQVKIPVEPWFPAELIAQSELSGDDTLKGVAVPANEFVMPPYSDGRISRIDNSEYFVLELFAR